MEQVILRDSRDRGSGGGDFDVGKYRASAEIKQQRNQWGAGLMNNAWRGVLPTTPFEALREEAQTSIKYAGGGQIIGPLITCMNGAPVEGLVQGHHTP